MIDRLTTHFDFHGEALKLRSERQRLIASNIANADTPHFQARDFNFGAALADATQQLSTTHAKGARLARTDAAHFAQTHAGIAGGRPGLLFRQPAQGALDDNTVDMDVERANFAENSLRYEASLRFLNGQVKTLSMAINGQ